MALHLGPLQLRWYGLAYLAGFIVAGWVFDKLSRDGFVALSRRDVSDLIGWLVAGVIVGGRLGYALIYDRSLFARPFDLLRVWRGGLSFHGGLLGVVLFSALFARRHHVPWRRLADAMALAVPSGIFFVRCANFINGELYGRIASAGVPWAMRFPTDPMARVMSREMAAAGPLNWHTAMGQLEAAGQWERVAAVIPLRHPSQLYEALLEGLVIAVILWTVYRRRRATLKPGAVAALFLVLYAVLRFLVECTRQPDAQLGFVLGPFSMGQLLSAALLIGAAVIYRWPDRDSNVRSQAESAQVL